MEEGEGGRRRKYEEGNVIIQLRFRFAERGKDIFKRLKIPSFIEISFL